MGCYVNPAVETKEAFLNENGITVSESEFSWVDLPEDTLPVVWVDNGPFTAAGVAYKEDEYKAFTSSTDPRLRQVYLVDIEKLRKVSDLDRYMPL